MEKGKMSEGFKIIENGKVVTCDSQRRMGEFSILIKGDRIGDINTRSDVLRSIYPSAEIIDASGKIVFPGFIDAHVHGESFLLRHLTVLKPYAKWSRDIEVRKALEFVRQRATPQQLTSMYRLGYFSALKSGVTSVGEFGFDNLDQPLPSSFEAMRRADLRGSIGVHNADQIDRSRSFSHPSIRFALVFPAEEDLTTYNLQNTLRLVGDLKWTLVVHAGETKKGLETIRRNFQKTLIRLLRDHNLLDHSALMHFACLDATDLDILADVGAPVVLTPRSVLLKETEPPPLSELNMRRIPLVLASDWGASDPFDVIRAYILLARDQGVNIPTPGDLIGMMTSKAGELLGLQDDVGSLQIGKKADMTFLDVSSARFAGIASRDFNEQLSLVLMEATTRDVSDVMINGEFFVREGQVLTYSEEELIREGEQLMKDLSESGSSVQEPSPDSQRFAKIGVPQQGDAEEQFEEGFRIVSRMAKPKSENKIIPLQVEQTKKIKPPPRKIKKVFGDDDL